MIKKYKRDLIISNHLSQNALMNFTRLTYLFILTTLSGLSLVSTSFAEGEIEVQFVSFPKQLDAKPIELLVGEGKTELIEMPTNSISTVYKIKPLTTWIVGKKIVDEKGKESFDIYGQAPAISSPKQLILAIRKGKNDSDGFELIPMDNQSSNFGGGKYFLMNATRVNIAGTIGTEKFSLKPSSHSLIAPKPTKTDGDRKYVYTEIYFKKGEDIQSFFSATWRFNENARSMVFCYHDPKSQKLGLHIIRDYVK